MVNDRNGTTPRHRGAAAGGAMGPFQGPPIPHDSPLFLPVLPVEPSPTTGIQHCIPPLFHGTTARRALASVAHRSQAGSGAAPPASPGMAAEAAAQYGITTGQLPMEATLMREHAGAEAHVGGPSIASDDAAGQQQWGEVMAITGFPGVGPPNMQGAGVYGVAAIQNTTRGSGKQSVANHDGWQWRKYGEKLVKNSINPRSYYKCSHANCGAKKIVERNSQGEILNTEYKGEHTHPAPTNLKPARFKPKTARQQANAPPVWTAPVTRFNGARPLADLPPAIAEEEDGEPYVEEVYEDDDTRHNQHSMHHHQPGQASADNDAAMAQAYHSSVQHQQQLEYQHISNSSHPHHNHMPHEMMVYEGHADAVAGIRRLRADHSLSAESPSKRLDLLAAYAAQMEENQFNDSAPYPNDQEDQDVPQQQQEDEDDVQPDPDVKRQRLDIAVNDQDESLSGDVSQDISRGDNGMGAAAVGHTRVVEAVTAEDGFRWRKYGQKSVKGSPHPRSYYKCTNMDCPVRKHVERSLYDDGVLVITYEGCHNHGLPHGSAAHSGGAWPVKSNSGGYGQDLMYDDASVMDDGQQVMEYSPHAPKARSVGRVTAPGRKTPAASPGSRPPRASGSGSMQGQQSQSGAVMSAVAGTAVNMPILMQGQPGQHPMMYGTLDQFAVMLQRQQDAPVAWDPATCLITPKIQGLGVSGMPAPLSRAGGHPLPGATRVKQQVE